MNNEIVLLLEALLSLGIAFFFVYLSKYRYYENKRYASKYENKKNADISIDSNRNIKIG